MDFIQIGRIELDTMFNCVVSLSVTRSTVSLGQGSCCIRGRRKISNGEWKRHSLEGKLTLGDSLATGPRALKPVDGLCKLLKRPPGLFPLPKRVELGLCGLPK